MDKILYPNDKPGQMTHGEQVFGSFKTVSTKTTKTPANWFSQIEIYISGGTKLLRIYDLTNATWREITIN
jgi:hypothetical protein